MKIQNQKLFSPSKPIPKSEPEDKETPHDKFVRLVNHRLSVAIKYIRMIGPLGNGGYAYSIEEVDKIEKRLHDEVNEVMAILRKHRPTSLIDKIL